MKKLLLFVIICSCVFIWISGGCNKPESNIATQTQNKIPPDIAGTWQLRNGVFRFVIEPNGVVSSAVIQTMETTIRPHQTTIVKMKDGNESTFIGGDCLAEYNPSNRELSVIIEVNDINIRFFDYHLEHGSTIDRFIGPVSADGKVWRSDWINVFDYGPDIPQDVNDIEPSLAIFDKVEAKDAGLRTEGRKEMTEDEGRRLMLPPGAKPGK